MNGSVILIYLSDLLGNVGLGYRYLTSLRSIRNRYSTAHWMGSSSKTDLSGRMLAVFMNSITSRMPCGYGHLISLRVKEIRNFVIFWMV